MNQNITRIGTGSFPALPHELYRHIFAFLTIYSLSSMSCEADTSTLSRLCVASRRFQSDAETILYNGVTLTEPRGDIDQVVKRMIMFFETVSENSRLAMKVHSLSIPAWLSPAAILPDNRDDQSFQDLIQRGFTSLVSLEKITAYPPNCDSRVDYSVTGTAWWYLSEWTFGNSTFKLRRLLTADWSSELNNYLISWQPIEEFAITDPAFSRFSWNISQKPTVVHLDVDIYSMGDSDFFYSDLPLVKLFWRNTHDTGNLKKLQGTFGLISRYSETLTHLFLDGVDAGPEVDFGPLDILECVSRALPKLIHLAVCSWNKSWGIPDESFRVEDVAKHLAKLCNLRVFSVSYSYEDDGAHVDAYSSSEQYVEISTLLMTRCPSINMLVFPAGNNPVRPHERIAYVRARPYASKPAIPKLHFFEGPSSFDVAYQALA